MRALPTLLTTLLLALSLAGCADLMGEDDDAATPTPTPTETMPTPTPTVDATPTPTETTPVATPTATPTPGFGSDTYALAVSGLPTQVETGKPFNFTLHVNGTMNATTDHVGAHYANNTTVAPVATAMRSCDHQGGALPGTFTVSCNITEPGTWHLYGHARYNDSGSLVNWWAAPQTIKVRNFTVETSGVPASTPPLTNNTNITFKVYLNGTETVATDHIGAHFWNATQSAPSTTGAGACAHQAGNTTGVYDVTCTISHTGGGGGLLNPLPQTVYLRAHLRLTEGGVALNWWSSEMQVSVLPT